MPDATLLNVVLDLVALLDAYEDDFGGEGIGIADVSSDAERGVVAVELTNGEKIELTTRFIGA